MTSEANPLQKDQKISSEKHDDPKPKILHNPMVMVLGAGIIFIAGVVVTFLFMQDNSNSPTFLGKLASTAGIGKLKSDTLASKAIEDAQNLAFRIEAGMNFQEYSVKVSDLAVSVKTYLVSDAAFKNPKLSQW